MRKCNCSANDYEGGSHDMLLCKPLLLNLQAYLSTGCSPGYSNSNSTPCKGAWKRNRSWPESLGPYSPCNSDEVPSSCPSPVLTSAFAVIWRMNQTVEDSFVPVPTLLSFHGLWCLDKFLMMTHMHDTFSFGYVVFIVVLLMVCCGSFCANGNCFIVFFQFYK